MEINSGQNEVAIWGPGTDIATICQVLCVYLQRGNYRL